MRRLNAIGLASLPCDIRRPGYDRDRLEIGMAHLSVGAFHRCHQAGHPDRRETHVARGMEGVDLCAG